MIKMPSKVQVMTIEFAVAGAIRNYRRSWHPRLWLRLARGLFPLCRYNPLRWMIAIRAAMWKSTQVL